MSSESKKFNRSMSTSTSSSHLLPASISQSWNHDVFLSFRGEDTRKSFVDHLYAALVQQGIQTYKDDETLARGESIGPSLLKAIQESRIAVIVFSKNYANSSWCLDELVCIIECMDKRRQIVMPIFYDIDPSDVRKQNGKYGEALDKHRKENKDKAESWREALVKAGNLSGWVPKDFANGHEAKCIKDIVGAISTRLSLRIMNVNKDLIGIESRLLDLKSKLKIGSGGVRMVGVWGVGGGGKTTLASVAYTEISHQFEAYCFLENIRDESSKHGLKRLQENFLSLALKTKVILESEIEGRSMIQRRLCHKTVLVVLDDVDDLKQLEALAGSHDWFGEGSRIIITTRDEHLLTCMANTIYEVSLLSHDEAMKLFNRHAYREDDPVEDYEVLSLDMVSYAGGLPLALKILGSFLYDKEKDEWMSVLAKLKCTPDVKVMERLKISYDGLERNEKEVFLDIACFLRRSLIEEAMMVLDACGLHAAIGVKVLVQKSLIKLSNGMLDMHDLIEELAHYIVRGEQSNNPEKHSRIWQEKDIVEFCSMDASTLMENEALALPSYGLDPRLPRLISLPSYVSHPRLPDVVANMKKLRWISWEGYPASSFPMKFHPTKLGFLRLIRGQQNQLWKGCKHLPNLKVLEVYASEYLIRTPDFNGLPCLERLNLEGCLKLKEIHPSIGYHEKLVYVNMNQCSELQNFPPIKRMKKLETLRLSCTRLKKFPDIRTNMESLVNLHLEKTSIEIIPLSVGQFCTNLAFFDLRYCYRLKRIEGNFALLKRLKILHLCHCDQLQKLPDDFFDKECCLKVLTLSTKNQDSTKSQESTSSKSLMNCIKLHSFHQDYSLGLKLPQFPRFIRKLDLSWCHLGDGDLPSDMSELSNLKLLYLRGNNFSRLHSSLSQIPCLKFLDLSDCKSLLELLDLPSSIAILKAEGCESLESVGDLSIYKCLWNVSLANSNGRVIHSMFHDRVLHSMLQVNAVEDRFMSVKFPAGQPPTSHYGRTFTLQLPHNWHTDFTGFLFCADNYSQIKECTIVIKQDMSMDSRYADYYCHVFGKNTGAYEYTMVGYVPFTLFRRTPWWNIAYTQISFQILGLGNPKVELVPKGDSRETVSDCSGFWDEDHEVQKTFEIVDFSTSSSMQILWRH